MFHNDLKIDPDVTIADVINMIERMKELSQRANYCGVINALNKEKNAVGERPIYTDL